MTKKEQTSEDAKRTRQEAVAALNPQEDRPRDGASLPRAVRTPEKLFGQKLFCLREKKKLTLSEAARRVGLLRGSLNNIEKGNRFPSVEVALQLASFYRWSPESALELLRLSQNAVLAKQHASAIAKWKRRQASFEFSSPVSKAG